MPSVADVRAKNSDGDMKREKRIPPGVRSLGVVSLLMDTSSELVHSLLPIFLTTVLGASSTTIGLLEGVAEATASMTKVVSGALSDLIRNRKVLLLAGYGLAAATKPVFPLANSVLWVFGARFMDRIGKGIRGAPRDALIADLTTPEVRGAAYGLRQAMDSVGAVLGPLLGLVLLTWGAVSLKGALWVAVVPALLSVGWLLAFVPDAPHEGIPRQRLRSLLAGTGRLPASYWHVVVLGILLGLSRFSEAFLVLRAGDTGVAVGLIPAVMIATNVTYSISAYPAGILADRRGRVVPLGIGIMFVVVGDVVLAVSSGFLQVIVGCCFWGLHLGFTQGVLSKMVAEASPADLRGTAFGLFNLMMGIALLGASVLAGALWDGMGPQATFLAGAGFAVISGLWLMTTARNR